MTTILVVDDEDDMRLLVRMAMDMAGETFEIVAEAADGAEAIAIWRGLAGPSQPDVVILDNRMPHANGVDIARQILQERPQQIVVLFSSFLDDRIRAEAAGVGVAACVTKDDVATLPLIISRLAASARPQRAGRPPETGVVPSALG